MDRKRKISGHDLPIPRKFPSPDYRIEENDERDFLTLSLSSFQQHGTPPSQHLPFISPVAATPAAAAALEPSPPPTYTSVAPVFRRRPRRNPTKRQSSEKSETVPAAFPWAENRRARIRSLNYLRLQGISSISGEVECKRCERRYEIELDLEEKFREIGGLIAETKGSMHHRAPKMWMNPSLPKCRFCEQENCVRPVIADKKRAINWLFLLLGQMLGCCTLEQLKYFCKHTKNHRTGAKDRVLFLAYLGLCRQLDPNGPFDI